MKGLDTHVLVRYLTQDDPAQARKVNAIIAEAIEHGEPCSINIVVLCELAWVLKDAYDFEKPAIVTTLARLLDTAQLVVEHADVARKALEDYRVGPADFADYVIGWRNRETGCAETVTFDRALRGSRLFRIL